MVSVDGNIVSYVCVTFKILINHMVEILILEILVLVMHFLAFDLI